MSTTLPLFWHLSSASQKDRIEASVQLITALEQFQTQFVPKSSTETSDDEADEEQGPTDGLDSLNAQDVSYSIRRLIRGLASPRESSRLGFAVALTEVCIHTTLTCQCLTLLPATVTRQYSNMLADCFDYLRLVKNPWIYDRTRGTRCTLRAALWS